MIHKDSLKAGLSLFEVSVPLHCSCGDNFIFTSIHKDPNSGSLGALVGQTPGMNQQMRDWGRWRWWGSLVSLWLNQAEWEILTAQLEMLRISIRMESAYTGQALCSASHPKSPPYLLYSVTDAKATRLDGPGLATSLGDQWLWTGLLWDLGLSSG